MNMRGCDSRVVEFVAIPVLLAERRPRFDYSFPINVRVVVSGAARYPVSATPRTSRQSQERNKGV
jgi:hypothetical protein